MSMLEQSDLQARLQILRLTMGQLVPRLDDTNTIPP